ncbi:MAG: hypothetical protein LBU30_05720 [Candidatus Methanoplasma sp.]|jgi:hypothetical protein|nr:hypothetical protein [Candidatus Methanoplasma sp.]
MDDYDDIPRNPVGYAALSLACGLAGVAIVLALSEQSMISVMLGAVGMVVGGFAINLGNHFPTDDRIKFMAISAAGILMSVMAFMFGLANWVG